jgi:imidazoleglycerol-phosphate dehydratase
MDKVLGPEEAMAKVVQLQNNLGLTDRQMAEKIGCSRVTYQQTRTGKKKVGSAFYTGALKLMAAQEQGAGRTASLRRNTAETNISLELNVDGTGKYEISTGMGMLDHLVAQLARHGKFDIKLSASGDDPHHVAEDIAICLGQAFLKALGDKRGIARMADATVPMDEALATAVVDLSGRGYAVIDLTFSGNDMPGFPSDLVRHFLETFAIEGRLNLHARVLYGNNDHHKAEALFKALARALDTATRIDERVSGALPSTKEFLES